MKLRNEILSGGKPPPAVDHNLSIVSQSLRVLGNLVTEGMLQVDGEVSGDVSAANLTIGASGRIEGAVKATEVRIHGTVAGRVTSDKVHIAGTALVKGDVECLSVVVESGARIEGHYNIREAGSAGSASTYGTGADSVVTRLLTNNG